MGEKQKGRLLMERKRGLSQEALKGIACVTMLMDHYAVVIHYSL